MGNRIHKASRIPVPKSSQHQPTIWLALAGAILLHTLLLLPPMVTHEPDSQHFSPHIAVQLVPLDKKPPDKDIILPAQPPAQQTMPVASKSANESRPLANAPAALTPAIEPLPAINHDPDKMNPGEKASLTHSILSSQFITRESAVDQIFGKQFAPFNNDMRKDLPARDFHFPQQHSMIKMLDQPMQALPFEYSPGLVRFAYEPGIRGDLQRFWDVITPEFGWRTNNGTEFRCTWVLVIAACGWK